MNRTLRRIAALAPLLLAACAPQPSPPPAASAASALPAPQRTFMDRLATLCGRAFEGRLTTADPADAAMATERMVMHVASCRPGEVRIPFHVGEDRSRSWVISETADGLRLKHDHRHADGSSDPVTMYGGDTASPGSAGRQSFPADAHSIALFRREGLDVSVHNIWSIELDGDVFAYELRRPASADNRHFRVEFDLSEPVAPPPPAWGSE